MWNFNYAPVTKPTHAPLLCPTDSCVTSSVDRLIRKAWGLRWSVWSATVKDINVAITASLKIILSSVQQHRACELREVVNTHATQHVSYCDHVQF